MEEGSSMSEFLQHVKELINELACIGEETRDSEIVENVLMALPDSYEGLVNTLMYRPSLPSVSELTVILLQDDLRREIGGTKRTKQEALFTKKSGSSSRRTRTSSAGQKNSSGGDGGRFKLKKSDSGECHYCGSTKH